MIKNYKKCVKLVKDTNLFKLYLLRKMWQQAKLDMKYDDFTFAKYSYKKKMGKELNLDMPRSFDEKLWFLKLNYRHPLLTKCTDKNKVRDYVAECGLSEILNEQFAIYKDARHVDFDKLPDEVFLKCNHTSNCNMIYRKKEKFNKRFFIKMFNYTLKKNHYILSREWNYKNIEPCIICEKVLPINKEKPLLDYRFFCFSGIPKLLAIDINTSKEDGSHGDNTKRNIYDIEFNQLNIKFSKENITDYNIEKPINYEKMVEYAKVLSAPFVICRVDLYNIEGNVYFGEMTFYHAGGYNNIIPCEWDRKIADWIDLSKLTNRVKETQCPV